MPLWAEVLAWAVAVLCLLAGLLILLLALLHLRFTAAWSGAWGGTALSPHNGFARFEFGFPGFMRRAWEWPPAMTPPPDPMHSTPPEDHASREAPASPRKEAAGAASATGKAEEADRPNGSKARKGSRSFKITPRMRRALFRLVTDGPVWKYTARYVLRSFRRGARLLHLRVEMAAGHPDPVFLGRMAGYWYALSPLLSPRSTTLGFRFQDRHPSFRFHATAAFSVLSFLWFGVLLCVTFPGIRLGRRAWHSWRRHNLTGWRERIYRSLQA